MEIPGIWNRNGKRLISLPEPAAKRMLLPRRDVEMEDARSVMLRAHKEKLQTVYIQQLELYKRQQYELVRCYTPCYSTP